MQARPGQAGRPQAASRVRRARRCASRRRARSIGRSISPTPTPTLPETRRPPAPPPHDLLARRRRAAARRWRRAREEARRSARWKRTARRRAALQAAARLGLWTRPLSDGAMCASRGDCGGSAPARHAPTAASRALHVPRGTGMCAILRDFALVGARQSAIELGGAGQRQRCKQHEHAPCVARTPERPPHGSAGAVIHRTTVCSSAAAAAARAAR